MPYQNLTSLSINISYFLFSGGINLIFTGSDLNVAREPRLIFDVNEVSVE